MPRQPIISDASGSRRTSHHEKKKSLPNGEAPTSNEYLACETRRYSRLSDKTPLSRNVTRSVFTGATFSASVLSISVKNSRVDVLKFSTEWCQCETTSPGRAIVRGG